MENIVYIPGLGADERLFSEIEKLLPGRHIIWPKNYDKSSIETFIKETIRINNIDDQDVLIGFSFGGIIAKEVKKVIPNVKVISISSCKNSSVITDEFKRNIKLLRFIPNIILRFALVYIGPIHVAGKLGIDKKYVSSMKNMAYNCDLSFFRWASQLCVKWNDKENIKDIIRIHGEFDNVIPFEKEDADYIIKDAGHLLIYTHIDEVYKIISENINE